MTEDANAYFAERDKPPERKDYPLARGLLFLFPNACAAVAHCSLVGAKQHGLDDPGVWDRDASDDHEDALLRHLMDAGHHDTDGVRHSAKVAWRALAILQLEIEAANK